jgi:hypothetical protein
MLRQIKHKITGGKIAAVLISLGLSVFFIALFIFSGLSKQQTFADQATGRPLFDKLLPTGTLVSDQSVVELPDNGRTAYVAGYSLGSQSGIALIVWDASKNRFTTAANRLFAKGVSGSAAQPPRLTLEPLGEEQPTLIGIRAAVGEQADGLFFALREGDDLTFIQMIDSFGKSKTVFFVVGDIPSQNEDQPDLRTLNSADLLLQDVDNDGIKEIAYFSRTFEVGEGGSGWVTSVDAYSWKEGQFVFDKDLSFLLTKGHSMFPEPAP